MLWMMERAGKKKSNNLRFQWWQQNNHLVALAHLLMAHQKLHYIHYNPVEAGIVDKPEEYLYSSVRDYWGGKGLIPISFLDPLPMR